MSTPAPIEVQVASAGIRHTATARRDGKVIATATADSPGKAEADARAKVAAADKAAPPEKAGP